LDADADADVDRQSNVIADTEADLHQPNANSVAHAYHIIGHTIGHAYHACARDLIAARASGHGQCHRVDGAVRRR
jgi:hypothetical protein